jgi:MFS family permease
LTKLRCCNACCAHLCIARYPRRLLASTLRSNRSLRRLLGAWLQSCIGTGVGYVALLLLTIHYLHASWAIPAVLLADFLPAIALGAVFGSWADRYSRRRLIVVANLVQAAAWGGLALVHGAAPIITLALVAGVGNALGRPAMRASLPVVAGEHRQAAAAWFDTCRWVGITIGPLFAAGLFALSGVSLPLALNGLSFLVAAAILATLPLASASHSERSDEARDAGIRSGLEVAFAAPGILVVVACSASAVVASGLLNVSEPLLITDVLHRSGTDYALAVACAGVGMVAGSVLIARRSDVGGGLIIRRYLGALLLVAVGMGACAISGSIATAMLAFAAIGFANAVWSASEAQLIQLRVPNAVLGRLFGARDNVEAVAFLIGLVGAWPFIAVAGVRHTLAAGAVICGACAVAATVMLAPGTGRRADAPAAELLLAAAADPTIEPPVRRRFDPRAAGGSEDRETAGALAEGSPAVPASTPRS